MLTKLSASKSVDDFLKMSRRFAEMLGLTERKIKHNPALKARGIESSVALFGQTVFTVISQARAEGAGSSSENLVARLLSGVDSVGAECIKLHMNHIPIPPDHPRAKSLYTRERLINGFRRGLVVPEGLIAHGRGEAYDYLLGERTTKTAQHAIKVATGQILLLSNRPVISVNGNTAPLCQIEWWNLQK